MLLSSLDEVLPRVPPLAHGGADLLTLEHRADPEHKRVFVLGDEVGGEEREDRFEVGLGR